MKRAVGSRENKSRKRKDGKLKEVKKKADKMEN